MPSGCFAERIGDLVALTDEEKGALDRLEERERHLKRGAILQRENEPVSEVFIIAKGSMISYVLLDDGSRQILRILFPGDMIGTSALVFKSGTESVAALSDCVVCPFERSALAKVIADHPRLGGLIFVYHHIDRVVLTDRLASLGRTSAKSRVAAIVLEMRDRLKRSAGPSDSSFALGLTQEEIGDATGLTAVHVNRMLRQLEDSGLICRENGRLTINDEARLARIANYVDRRDELDLGWLPPSR